MNLFIALEIGLREIFSHKFRSFLSMLGILLGVSSLIATMALTNGVERGMKAVLREVGGVERVSIVNQEIPDQMLDFWNLSPGRTLQDAIAIKTSAPLVSHVSPEIVRGVAFSAGAQRIRQQVRGVWPDFIDINNHEVEYGRSLSQLDLDLGNRVVVLGRTISDQIWPGKGPDEILGQTIFLNQTPFVVVGLFKRYLPEGARKSSTNSRGRRFDPFRAKNEAAIIPFTTLFYEFMSGQFPENSYENVQLDTLAIKVGDVKHFQDALEQVRAALTVTHRGVEDFGFDTRQEWFDRMEASSRATRLSGGLISAISLLVGGIGITNIMLASISERVREIGIRRAIGATGKDIFVQILIESITIAIIGGLIGIIAGVGLAQILQMIAPNDNSPVLTFSSIVISVIFALVAGVVSGLYPAIKASQLDPIIALRYE